MSTQQFRIQDAHRRNLTATREASGEQFILSSEANLFNIKTLICRYGYIRCSALQWEQISVGLEGAPDTIYARSFDRFRDLFRKCHQTGHLRRKNQ